MKPRSEITITAHKADGKTVSFTVDSRIDTSVEVGYYRNGGILQTVLRQMINN
jgi:aconitate hydratase